MRPPALCRRPIMRHGRGLAAIKKSLHCRQTSEAFRIRDK